MTNCAVRGCKNVANNKGKSRRITFHVFPKDNAIRKKWVEAVVRHNWLPGPRSTICSEHFRDDCFDLTKKTRCLLKNSIPTLNLKISENKQANEIVEPGKKQENDRVPVEPENIQANDKHDVEPKVERADSPSKEMLKSRIKLLEYTSHQRLLNIKRIQQSQWRMRQKIRHKDDLIELQKRMMLPSNDVGMLNSFNAEVLKRQVNIENTPNEKKKIL